MSAPFRQVKASAGSGKTYALTLRFLDLLAGCAEDAEADGLDGQEGPDTSGCRPGSACAAAGRMDRRYTWPEILAITFTNKAAAEMRERVLGALKERALGHSSGPGKALEPDKARRLLLEILRHTQHLGIRTIDSLLSLLVRLFALDQGLKPDFDTVFDESEALQGLLDRFLARCAADESGAEAALFEQAVRTLMEHEDKDGFWLQDVLRERFIELAKLLLQLAPALPGPLTTDQKRMADLLSVSYGELRLAVDALSQAVDGENLAPQANFLKMLDKFREAELFGKVPADSAYLAKDDLDECLLAKSKGRRSAAAQRAYEDFQTAAREHIRCQAVLSPAYALAPCVEIALVLLRGLGELQREKGFLFGAQMAGIVGQVLDGGLGVPDAFCRLGDRLHHLLVDEFQDTSRAQWSAAQPRASECLSKGGSLFYVGDVKQAIYGWRGGDARLFDEVAGDDELLAMSGGLKQDALPHNWRSRPEIIGFNNRVFSRLGDAKMARDVAETLLSGAPDDVLDAFVERIGAAFADSAQAVPEREGEQEPGRVQVRLLPATRTEDALEQGLDALADSLKNDILLRRRPGDVAVLVRTANHSDKVCERLVAEGLPIITENSLQLARHPVVGQVVSLLRLLDAPPDDVSFLAFVTGEELFLAESGLTLPQVLDWAATARGGGAGKQKGGLLSRFRDDFPEIHARLLAPFLLSTGLMRPYDLVQAALDTFQVLARHPEAELYVRRLLEVVHLAEEQGMGSLPRFLEFWGDKGVEEKVPLPESADAIRILTIHKSKGLQFPVCMVPFHNWSAGPRGELGVVELHGHRLLTRLTKALGRQYYENQAEGLMEQANLLYVAWTRAEEELYAFVPGTGDNQRLGPVPVLLHHLLEIPAEEAGLELGSAPACAGPVCQAPAAPPTSRDVAPLGRTPEFQAWLPRLRVFRHAVEDAGFDERARGKLAHKAVELLRPTGDDNCNDRHDARRAALLAFGEFPELRALADESREKLHAQVEEMLLWLLARPEARPHLGKAGEELTILDEDGGFLRPDLLHFAPDGPVVLEFKTGHAEAEHARQLRGYLALARDIAARRGQPSQPKGFLVYLDRRVVEPVSLGKGDAA
ncbi:MAG: UvrD-helicase domain-containing protein [Desulfovibrio sp.]|nr:UvrD-helicase domain-containing protein [Desulfovibrio sp.]